jgi:hypothetical protein
MSDVTLVTYQSRIKISDSARCLLETFQPILTAFPRVLERQYDSICSACDGCDEWLVLWGMLRKEFGVVCSKFVIKRVE